MPYASARFDMSFQTGECCHPGVDSAHSLFSQKKSVFVFQSWARLSDSWNAPVFVAPSPKKATATRGSSRSLNASPAPTIAGRPPPTTAFAPRLPRSTSFGCVPRASVCPCARCVDANTSPSSIASHAPTSAASCPIATCRKPGRSPARKRSSTFSSNRLISSISRRKSRSRSSDTPRRFSTFATSRLSVLLPRAAGHPVGRARCGGGRGSDPTHARGGRARGPRRPAPRPAPAAPLRRRRADVPGPRAERGGQAPARAARPGADPRRPRGGRLGSGAGPPAGAAGAGAARVVGRRARRAPSRLERPARRARALVLRRPRPSGRAPGAAQPPPRRRARRLPLPLGAQLRLRRLAADGAALPRAPGRGPHPRLGSRPARPLRHSPRADPGSGVAARREDRVRRFRAAARETAEHAGTLARLELELRRLELKRRATAVGVGAGLGAGAALLALLALGFALAAAAAALAAAVPLWVALLVVAGGLLLLAGVLGAVAASKLR